MGFSQYPPNGTSAAEISNTPAGSISATDVQDAINELDSEKAALAGSSGQAFSTAALTTTGLFDISGASAGQIKFPATQNPSADANTLDDYEEATSTLSFTGFTTTPTLDCKITKIGRLVTLTPNATGISATSNATTKTAGTLASEYRPAFQFYAPCFSADNGGTKQIGSCLIKTDGTIEFWIDVPGNGWTASGTAAIYIHPISWSV